jgi:hypothetical protein
MATREELRRPTPDEFDRLYDGTIEGLTWFKTTPLYGIVRGAITSTPAGAMPHVEVTDEMVVMLAHEMEAEHRRQNPDAPFQAKERPILKALLEMIIKMMMDQFLSGGFGGLFPQPS